MANRAMNQFNLTFEKRMVSVFAAVMSQGQGKIPTLDNINAWDSAFTYSTGATVVYVGGVYVSLQGSNTNQNPTTATTYWALTNIPLPTPGVVGALGVGYGAALSPYPAASAYAGGTTYSAGQIVTNGGLTYVCIATTTGNAPPNTTYWLQITYPPAGNTIGAFSAFPSSYTTWNNATAYSIGNVVLYSGINYVAIATTSNTNKIPSSQPTFWAPCSIEASYPVNKGVYSVNRYAASASQDAWLFQFGSPNQSAPAGFIPDLYTRCLGIDVTFNTSAVNTGTAGQVATPAAGAAAFIISDTVAVNGQLIVGFTTATGTLGTPAAGELALFEFMFKDTTAP